MKNKFYHLIFLLMLGQTCLSAVESSNKLMQEVLLPPNAQPLTLNTIAFGEPIHALNITILNWTAWDDERNIYAYPESHNAQYISAEINTFFDLHEDSSFAGKQEVCFRGGEKSETRIWCTEIICGKKYIVHFHEDFRVYSAADTQFVIANFQ
jgi:hypothetical protein